MYDKGVCMVIKKKCVSCFKLGLARFWHYDERGEMVETIRLFSGLSENEKKEFELMAWVLNCPACMKDDLKRKR